MATILTKAQTVDIGGGRGRLAPVAAASLHRVDAALGRLLDVNSAWRDPKMQQKLYDAYEAYLAGGPWAAIALKPSESIHPRGYAVDTDDHSPAMVRLLLEHGWVQTVYRWVNGRWTLVEPWHFEYQQARDQHRNDPALAGLPEQEDDMAIIIASRKDPNKPKGIYDPQAGRITRQISVAESALLRSVESKSGGAAASFGDVTDKQYEDLLK
ncbi:M15 family metallopeptidase [Microbacterium sp.]|uniref:M15 family metallopeptidase n=1 Tax=Microbacterium sp. TaxID=51671 RepID=UPI003A93BB32